MIGAVVSEPMDGKSKRWTAKRKSALVLDIMQGKTTVAEAGRACDLDPSEIEGWIEDARKGIEGAFQTGPSDIDQQYKKEIHDLQKAYDEVMLELRARKKLQDLLDAEDGK